MPRTIRQSRVRTELRGNKREPSPRCESWANSSARLLQSVSDAIDSADTERNCVKVSSNRRRKSNTLVSLGRANLDDEPIDCLDILSIEPHLLARTILDVDRDVGEIRLLRDVLARMLVHVESIEDEELDVLCTAEPGATL
jgi:hypothetical protein